VGILKVHARDKKVDPNLGEPPGEWGPPALKGHHSAAGRREGLVARADGGGGVRVCEEVLVGSSHPALLHPLPFCPPSLQQTTTRWRAPPPASRERS
jgi:hypothetical protein